MLQKHSVVLLHQAFEEERTTVVVCILHLIFCIAFYSAKMNIGNVLQEAKNSLAFPGDGSTVTMEHLDFTNHIVPLTLPL